MKRVLILSAGAVVAAAAAYVGGTSVHSAPDAATFAGATGASTDSSSTTTVTGTAEFTLTAASGQGTFPAAPASVGCSKMD